MLLCRVDGAPNCQFPSSHRFCIFRRLLGVIEDTVVLVVGGGGGGGEEGSATYILSKL